MTRWARLRERPGLPLDDRYIRAYEAMIADPNQFPLVVTLSGRVAGYLQVSFIPGLSRLGAWRGQIESVRIHEAYRGQKLGDQLIRHAIGLCRERAANWFSSPQTKNAGKPGVSMSVSASPPRMTA